MIHLSNVPILSQGRYLPYVPPQFVTETINFFSDRQKISELLDLIFSPLKPTDNLSDRREYQRQFEAYQYIRQLYKRRLERHEFNAANCMWKALRSLPSNLYKEASQSKTEYMPKELAFNYCYREDILKSLSDYEREKFENYSTLNHLRYPHLDIKRKSPGLFWIKESKAVSKQKQALLAKRLKLK